MRRWVAFAGFLVACLVTAVPVQAQIIKIGVYVPLSGPTANYGEAGVNGIKLATEDINATGGLIIGGKVYKFEAVIYDDRSDPKESASVMEKLISRDNVRVGIGSVSSSCCLAAQPAAERNRVVVISPYCSSMKLTESGFRYFFRGVPTQVPEWVNMPKYWLKQGWKTMAFLSLNDDYGKFNSSGLAKTFEENGGKVLGFEWYSLKDTDMYTQLKKIKEMKPDIVSTSGQTEQGSLIIRQGKEVWPEIRLHMSGGMDPKRLLDLAGSLVEGVTFSTPEPPPTPATIAFDKKYVEKFKVPVFWGYSKLPYDSMMVIAKAYQRAGKVDDPEALREAMLATDYDGLIGHWNFDKTGNSFLVWYYARFEKEGRVIIFDPRK
jgi:branched-chain amino acid transport system substrate-binding protein